MSAGTVIRKQNRAIRRYRQAGATEPMRACRPEDLGLRRSWVFNRMIDRGVFVPIADGRYFLDDGATERFLSRRRARILIFAVIAIVVFLIVTATRR